jgi:hypothetical protein
MNYAAEANEHRLGHADAIPSCAGRSSCWFLPPNRVVRAARNPVLCTTPANGECACRRHSRTLPCAQATTGCRFCARGLPLQDGKARWHDSDARLPMLALKSTRVWPSEVHTVYIISTHI